MCADSKLVTAVGGRQRIGVQNFAAHLFPPSTFIHSDHAQAAALLNNNSQVPLLRRPVIRTPYSAAFTPLRRWGWWWWNEREEHTHTRTKTYDYTNTCLSRQADTSFLYPRNGGNRFLVVCKSVIKITLCWFSKSLHIFDTEHTSIHFDAPLWFIYFFKSMKNEQMSKCNNEECKQDPFESRFKSVRSTLKWVSFLLLL